MDNKGQGLTEGRRMSALPKIAPRGTSVTVRSPCVTMPGSVSKMYEVWPPRLPTAPEISSRVNPLQPPKPQRRTVMWETVSPHWHNEFRTIRMKQREHYRYHNAWSKYYYGSVPEQESHRAQIRSVLKQQMQDKLRIDHHGLSSRVTESEKAVVQDKKCLQDDLAKFQKKNAYLSTYRDENKKLMENAWAEKRTKKVNEDKFDREQLRYNPINWSSTLT